MHTGDRSGTFALQPSRNFFILLSGLYLSAIVAVLLLPVLLWKAASIVFALLCSYGYHAYRDVLLKAGSSCLQISIDGLQVECHLRNGRVLAGNITGATLVTPVLTAIHVKIAGSLAGRTVHIFADSMAAEEFRKLRVLLKWGTRQSG